MDAPPVNVDELKKKMTVSRATDVFKYFTMSSDSFTVVLTALYRKMWHVY